VNEIKRQKNYRYTETDCFKVVPEYKLIQYKSPKTELLQAISFVDINHVSIYTNRVVVDHKAASRLTYRCNNKELRNITKVLQETELELKKRA